MERNLRLNWARKDGETATGEEKEVKEPDFSCGYITIIENGFAFKQGSTISDGR